MTPSSLGFHGKLTYIRKSGFEFPLERESSAETRGADRTDLDPVPPSPA